MQQRDDLWTGFSLYVAPNHHLQSYVSGRKTSHPNVILVTRTSALSLAAFFFHSEMFALENIWESATYLCVSLHNHHPPTPHTHPWMCSRASGLKWKKYKHEKGKSVFVLSFAQKVEHKAGCTLEVWLIPAASFFFFLVFFFFFTAGLTSDFAG